MESYFPIMTEQYRQKHYKDGVFAQMHKNTAKVSYLTYIFMGAVFVGGAYGTWWCINAMPRFRESDLTGFGIGMAVFCALFALIGLACILISVRRHLRGAEDWKERCAKTNQYTVSDMDEFERQALEMESRVICLVDPAKKILQGQEDGILTRDYIALTLNTPNIIKLADLNTACLVHQTTHAGSNHLTVEYLVVGLMSNTGSSVVAECSKESGTALIELLKERCPHLDTADGKILESSEYDDLWAAKFKK